MKRAGWRWWGWAGLAVLVVLAIRWVDGGEAPPAREAAVLEPSTPPEAARATAPAPTRATAELAVDRLRREPYPALTSDPFKSDLELDSPGGEGGFGGGTGAQRAGGGGGSPPPPPLPFTYMGKMLEDGETVVFLTKGDRNYLARKGATLDGQYRVDAIGPRTMVLTYLPAKAKQSLAIGSAP